MVSSFQLCMICLAYWTNKMSLCQGFMRLVDATGAEPYIVLNLAGKSGTEPPESRLYNSSQLKARLSIFICTISGCARSASA